MKLKFKGLFKVGYYSSIFMLILIPLQVIVYIAYPPPETVLGFYELYQESTILGLLSLDFIYLISNMMLLPIYVAITYLVWEKKPTLVIFALLFGVISLATYYPSNPTMDMLLLSKKYFSALPSDFNSYIVAGEVLIARYRGTAYLTYYWFGAISLLLFAWSLYKNRNYRTIGIWGLISGVLMAVPATFGIIGMIFGMGSLIPFYIFIILLAKEFKKLAKSEE